MSKQDNTAHLTAQTVAAARRLPDEVAAQFLALQQEAADEIIAGMQRVKRGAALRRAAWQLYRNVMLERAGELAACGYELDEIAKQLDMPQRSLHRLLAKAAREKYGAAPAGGAR